MLLSRSAHTTAGTLTGVLAPDCFTALMICLTQEKVVTARFRSCRAHVAAMSQG